MLLSNIFACMHSTYYNLCVRDMGRQQKNHTIFMYEEEEKKRQEADPTSYTRGQITLTTKQNTK